ncbi:MAG: pyridine nucleotide-disulfide oxidoreductase [Candidatus Nanohalarchaeota archaeon]|nr:MAG: pyridine nucleotide-disulfide oxidoreductase [Candidatus Nanohaloarchaeota archaeon]
MNKKKRLTKLKTKYDAIVIGGGPAGIIGAVTARKYYPDKKIFLIKSVGAGVIPCGIPYMFTTLGKPEDNAVGNAPLEKNNIDVKVDEVIEINPEEKKIKTRDNKEYGYEKIILATGSSPINPRIPGNNKKGIYLINKEMNHLKNLKKDICNAKDIVIVGGGFIGVEFADELSKIKGANVSIVEMMPHIMSASFDEEFRKLAKEKLVEKGVNIITGKSVEEFNGKERVESVLLSDNSCLPAQVVIMGIGAGPNSFLAAKAGLEIGKSRGIIVDEYMRTSVADIFAIGDCAEKKDFFTRKKINVMLASTATAEARIAGANLFKINVVKENKGTIAMYSTQIGDLTLASAGLTEKSALEEGFEIAVGRAECVDKHPGPMPGANKIKIKLIFSKQSGLLLGGQVAGGCSAGEIINIIGLAMQKATTLTEIETLQVATHPKLTAAPTIYPLINAAQNALKDCK